MARFMSHVSEPMQTTRNQKYAYTYSHVHVLELSSAVAYAVYLSWRACTITEGLKIVKCMMKIHNERAHNDVH